MREKGAAGVAPDGERRQLRHRADARQLGVVVVAVRYESEHEWARVTLCVWVQGGAERATHIVSDASSGQPTPIVLMSVTLAENSISTAAWSRGTRNGKCASVTANCQLRRAARARTHIRAHPPRTH